MPNKRKKARNKANLIFMENVVFIYGKKTKVVWNNEHLVSNK